MQRTKGLSVFRQQRLRSMVSCTPRFKPHVTRCRSNQHQDDANKLLRSQAWEKVPQCESGQSDQ